MVRSSSRRHPLAVLVLDPDRDVLAVESIGQLPDRNGPPVGVPLLRQILAVPGGGDHLDGCGAGLLAGDDIGRPNADAA